MPTHFFFVFDLKKLLEQEGGPNPQVMSYPVGSLYRARRDVGVVVVRVLWRIRVNDKTFTIYMYKPVARSLTLADLGIQGGQQQR